MGGKINISQLFQSLKRTYDPCLSYKQLKRSFFLSILTINNGKQKTTTTTTETKKKITECSAFKVCLRDGNDAPLPEYV